MPFDINKSQKNSVIETDSNQEIELLKRNSVIGRFNEILSKHEIIEDSGIRQNLSRMSEQHIQGMRQQNLVSVEQKSAIYCVFQNP